jgi:hypothetical protein
LDAFDIRLPKRDSFALLRDIRALDAESGSNLPVIAMAGLEPLPDRNQTIAAGFEAHLETDRYSRFVTMRNELEPLSLGHAISFLVIASTKMIIHAPLPLTGECLLCGEFRDLGYIDNDIGPICYDCAIDLYETEQRMITQPAAK